MLLGYRTQGFVLGSGERYCLLVNPDSGMPLFHPNLFVTTQVRNRSLSVASMDAASTAINVLLTYCAGRGIDLESRIRARRFFSPAELDAIRDECQRRRSKHAGPAAMPFRGRKARQRIGAGSEYARLTYIANYLRWLSHTLLGSTVDESTTRQIDLVHRGLIGRRPLGRRSAAVKSGPTPKQIATLQEVVDPAAGRSPFKDGSVCARNALIIDLLFYLGIRGGELLNICIKDIDWKRQQIVVARRPDEKSDPRSRQPLVKTLDRRIPLSDTLVERLHAYVVKHRNKVPAARKHDYLLVTHKSGKTLGQPLSIAGYQKIIKVLAAAAPELEGIHGHLLRHGWNERFSDYMDRQERPPSPERQEAMRSYAQGWKEGSGTSATYNRRFIQRKAHEAQLELQQSTIRLPKGVDNK
jgi:integrase